jgi:hypothetical protein
MIAVSCSSLGANLHLPGALAYAYDDHDDNWVISFGETFIIAGKDSASN